MQSIIEFTKLEVDYDYLVCFIKLDIIVIIIRLLENLLLKFLEQI